MQSVTGAMKSLIGRVKQIGERTCEECRSIVPIMLRDNEEVSICLKCENLKVQSKVHEDIIKNKIIADKKVFEKYSFIPSEIKNATFENFVTKTKEEEFALRTSKRYVEIFDTNQKNTLVFAGDVGTGKTHLAYSIAKEMQNRGKRVIFITIPDLLLSIRDTFKNSEMSEYELTKKYKEVDLLVLDDIGAEYISKKTGWGTEIIFSIVTARTDSPTIFTTNLNSVALESKYGGIEGKRIVSRMRKNATNLLFTGEDKRSVGW